MKNKTIPQYLFAASAVLFAGCSAMQFVVGQPLLGSVFAAIAVAGLVLFILVRTGRISW